jgi:hypothetical protein
MATVADRIRWVLAHGNVGGARAWCEKARISSSYLGTFLTRDRRGQESDIGVSILSKLADAANVSFAWLATGVGSPSDDTRMVPLPANLEALVKRRKDYPEPLVRQAAIVLELIGERDMSPEHWEDYLDGLRREARRLGLEAAASRLDERGIRGR